MKRKWKALLLTPTLAGMLLAGCSKSGSESTEGAGGEASETTAAEDMTVHIGLIKSISDHTLTVYLPVGGLSAGDETADGADESGGDGTTTGDSAAADRADGTDSAASDAAEGDSAGGGKSQASMDGVAQGFAGETVDIVVSDATVLNKSAAVIVQKSGADSADGTPAPDTGAAESSAEAPAAGEPALMSGAETIDATAFEGDAIALSDLAAGDFIAYTLLSDSNEAVRIALLPGNPYAASSPGGGAKAPAGGSETTASPQPSQTPAPSDAKPDDGPKDASAPQASGAPPADKTTEAKPAQGQSAAGDAAAGSGGSGAAAQPSAEASAPASASPPASAPAPADGGNGAPAAAEAGQMTIGKIKSISGNTITIYKASTPSAGDGGPSLRTPPSAEDGATPPASGEPSASAIPSGDASGGKGPVGGMMALTFTEETMDIEVTDATNIVSVTTTDGKRTETAISLGSLKAGDIIMIQLEDGTSQAALIRLTDGDGGASASAGE